MLMGPLCSYTFEARVFMANLSAHEKGTNSIASFKPRTSRRAWIPSLDFAKAGTNPCRHKSMQAENVCP